MFTPRVNYGLLFIQTLYNCFERAETSLSAALGVTTDVPCFFLQRSEMRSVDSIEVFSVGAQPHLSFDYRFLRPGSKVLLGFAEFCSISHLIQCFMRAESVPLLGSAVRCVRSSARGACLVLHCFNSERISFHFSVNN